MGRITGAELEQAALEVSLHFFSENPSWLFARFNHFDCLELCIDSCEVCTRVSRSMDYLPALIAFLPPTIILISAALGFGKRASEAFTEYRFSENFHHRIVPLFLIGSGGIVAVSLDSLDLSEIVFPDSSQEQRIQTLSYDIANTYDLSEKDEESILRRISDEFMKPKSSFVKYGVAGFFGIFSSLYLIGAFIVNRSDYDVIKETNKVKKDKHSLEEEVEAYKLASLSVEQIVRAKLARLKEQISRVPNPKDKTERLDLVKECLSPDFQLRGYVHCLHSFVKEIVFGKVFRSASVSLRVALFTVD